MAYVYAGKQPEFVTRPDGSRLRLKPCGTEAAYKRHLRNKEVACGPCCEAHAAKNAAEYQRRKKVS